MPEFVDRAFQRGDEIFPIVDDPGPCTYHANPGDPPCGALGKPYAMRLEEPGLFGVMWICDAHIAAQFRPAPPTAHA